MRTCGDSSENNRALSESAEGLYCDEFESQV